MIEIMQQTEDMVKLPKNIRQIGNPADNWKIYVEDYVYTYLHPAAEAEKEGKKVCVLLGKVERSEKNYIFISGAIAVGPLFDIPGLPDFTEEVWEYIYQQEKEYFGELEIVGWSVMTSFWPLHLLTEFENVHRKHFGGMEKVMLLMDQDEQEERFYRLQNGNLAGQPGYYIYYEKNEPMQNFMVQQYQKETPETVSETVSEGAVSNYRALMKEKREHTRPKAEHSIICAAGVLTAMAACVIGITTINNYEKMAGMQEAIQVLSQSARTENTEEDAETLKVENIESSIEPLENQSSAQTSGETGQTQAAGQATAEQTQAAGQTQTTGQATAEQTTAGVSQQPIDAAAAGSGQAVENQSAQDNGQAQTNPISAASGQTAAGQQAQLSEAETYKLQGYYVVQQGDSLAVISQKIYQSTDMVPQICAKNGIADENTIYIGQKLILP